MIVPPIIDRELRMALRSRNSIKSRFRIAIIAASIITVLGIFGILSACSDLLKNSLFYFALYSAVIPPLQLSVGLFNEERRNQTLELLYLTEMGPADLFGGKLVGGMLVAIGDLAALIPFMAIPFLSGGLSLDLFKAMIVFPPLLFLFTLAVGVLGSVVTRDDGAALVTAITLGGIACLTTLLPYWLGRFITGSAPFSAKWLCVSPAYGGYLVLTNFSGARPADFWNSAGFTLVWTFLALGLAAFFLRRNWQKEFSGNAPAKWRQRWLDLVRGSPSARTALRERLLPLNPFQWRAERDRQPVVLAWGIVSGACFLWLLGWAVWPHAWATPMSLYLTAGLIIVGTQMTESYAAGKQIGLERREGTLELLLTAPVLPLDIVFGQTAAIRAMFRPIRLTTLSLLLVMMLGGLFTRHWKAGSLVSYFVIWLLLYWMLLFQARDSVPRAMWITLNTGRPISSLFMKNRGNWGWIWIIMYGRSIFRALSGSRDFPSGSTVEVVIVVAFGVLVPLLTAAKNYEQSDAVNLLLTDMRIIAREPVPDSRDNRFKNWNRISRLPPSKSRFEELHACAKAYRASKLPPQ